MSARLALIIANTEYNDPGLAQLIAPGNDAVDFARVLKDKDICAFDQVNVLLNQTSSSIIEAIDEFFDQKKPDDLLVLYFSGHGVRDEFGSLYLAVKNTIRTRLRSTAIKSDYIREAIEQSRSKRQLFILDCCNSGAFPQGTKAEVGGVMGLTQAFQGYGRFILTASDATQFAWEGNKVIGETDNSLFTHFLVKGLEGEADTDSDGRITVDELYDYAYEQISKVTPKQTPTKSSSKVAGEIVLRQITRIEDIKPISLPDELAEAIEDSRTFVREGTVQQLEKLLKGKNLGLARSAREALERMEREDDSRRVSQAATQALESVRQLEQQAEEERRAREEAERQAKIKAEEERSAREKAETNRKANEEDKQPMETPLRTIWEERLAYEKAKAGHLIKQQAEAPQTDKEETKNLVNKQIPAERIAQEAEHGKSSEPEKQKEFDKLSLSPRWIALFWITLGWSIGLAVVAMGSTNDWESWAYIGGGAIIGFVLAISLRFEHVFLTWKTVFWITLGWSIGGATAAILARIAGPGVNGALLAVVGTAIGGLFTGISLYSIYVLSSWKSIIFVTLGWAFSLVVGAVTGYALSLILIATVSWASGLLSGVIDGAFSGAAVGVVCGAVSGIIGGFTTAIILQMEGILSNWKRTLWIALGWTVGMMFSGLISGAIVGAIFWLIHWATMEAGWGAMSLVIIGTIGGFTAALTLRSHRILSDRKRLFWIPLSWALSGAISLAIIGAILGASRWAPVSTILLVFFATIGGVMGGAITIRQIRKEKNNNLPV